LEVAQPYPFIFLDTNLCLKLFNNQTTPEEIRFLESLEGKQVYITNAVQREMISQAKSNNQAAKAALSRIGQGLHLFDFNREAKYKQVFLDILGHVISLEELFASHLAAVILDDEELHKKDTETIDFFKKLVDDAKRRIHSHLQQDNREGEALQIAKDRLNKLEGEWTKALDNTGKALISKMQGKKLADLHASLPVYNSKNYEAQFKIFLQKAIQAIEEADKKDLEAIKKDIRYKRKLNRTLRVVYHLYLSVGRNDRTIVNETLYFLLFEKKQNVLLISNDNDMKAYAERLFEGMAYAYLLKFPFATGCVTGSTSLQIKFPPNPKSSSNLVFTVFGSNNARAWSYPLNFAEIVNYQIIKGYVANVRFNHLMKQGKIEIIKS